MPDPIVSTAYPYHLQERRAQRTPYAHISGSEIDNVGGAVMSNAAVAGMNNAKNHSQHPKPTGSALINSDEAGSKPATGSNFGAITQKFKISVPNRNTKAKTKFTSDVSKGVDPTSWDYESGQLKSRYLVNGLGSELVTNVRFSGDANNWTLSGGAVWDASDRIHLLDGTMLSNTINFTAGVRYRLQFDLEDIADRETAVFAYITIGSETVSGLFHTNGTHTLDMVAPSTTTGAVGMGSAALTESDCYIDNVSCKAITSVDINATFGTDDELAKFKNGAAAIQERNYAGV